MPNRKAFDERDKYDHSTHPVGHRQPSDLAPDVEHPGDRRVDTEAVTSEEARTGTPVRSRRSAGRSVRRGSR
ncbi:MAG TPA: hypothetical protein VKT22_01940 [Steroidobacteraceae bacterium]|nr:hypothetical protein [Steroidobacteraceae bacterium]